MLRAQGKRLFWMPAITRIGPEQHIPLTTPLVLGGLSRAVGAVSAMGVHGWWERSQGAAEPAGIP